MTQVMLDLMVLVWLGLLAWQDWHFLSVSMWALMLGAPLIFFIDFNYWCLGLSVCFFIIGLALQKYLGLADTIVFCLLLLLYGLESFSWFLFLSGGFAVLYILLTKKRSSPLLTCVFFTICIHSFLNNLSYFL